MGVAKKKTGVLKKKKNQYGANRRSKTTVTELKRGKEEKLRRKGKGRGDTKTTQGNQKRTRE